MKTRFHYFLISGIVVLVIIVAAVFLFQAVVPAQKNSKDVSAEYQYMLKESDGKIAVYTKGQSSPVEIYEVYVSTLPKYDQDTLKKGIFITDENALQKAIEDYTS